MRAPMARLRRAQKSLATSTRTRSCLAELGPEFHRSRRADGEGDLSVELTLRDRCGHEYRDRCSSWTISCRRHNQARQSRCASSCAQATALRMIVIDEPRKFGRKAAYISSIPTYHPGNQLQSNAIRYS